MEKRGSQGGASGCVQDQSNDFHLPTVPFHAPPTHTFLPSVISFFTCLLPISKGQRLVALLHPPSPYFQQGVPHQARWLTND